MMTIKLVVSAILLLLAWFSASAFLVLNALTVGLALFWALPIYALMGFDAAVTALLCGASIAAWFVDPRKL